MVSLCIVHHKWEVLPHPISIFEYFQRPQGRHTGGTTRRLASAPSIKHLTIRNCQQQTMEFDIVKLLRMRSIINVSSSLFLKSMGSIMVYPQDMWKFSNKSIDPIPSFQSPNVTLISWMETQKRMLKLCTSRLTSNIWRGGWWLSLSPSKRAATNPTNRHESHKSVRKLEITMRTETPNG